MSHTVIAVTAMLLITLLAALHDLPGTDAMLVIVAAAGIGGAGAGSAVSADQLRRTALPLLPATPKQRPEE
jgi:hypothetical protein